VLVAHNEAELREAVSHRASLSLRTDAIVEGRDSSRLVEMVLKRHGHIVILLNIDTLVNNAGASWGASAKIYPLEAGRRSLT
jgi:hypothetical protein